MADYAPPNAPRTDSPATELRLAALVLKNPLRCGPVSIMSSPADWLDETADRAGENLTLTTTRTPVWGCDICDLWVMPGGCTCWDKALAVARAVLGGAS